MTVTDYIVKDIGSVCVELARTRAENDMLREILKSRDEEIARLREEMQILTREGAGV